ncbi:hypothetical protein GCM10009717_08480 [Agromyces allii]|uniref:Uncharacterized protein n=1 Tax=Agromyces allii TaxID=393607 RepID=A0ABN2Q5I1_9MICO
MGERTVAFDGERGDGVVVCEELESPDGAVEPCKELIGHVPSVAAASDIDSRESDMAERVAFTELWRTGGPVLLNMLRLFAADS